MPCQRANLLPIIAASACLIGALVAHAARQEAAPTAPPAPVATPTDAPPAPVNPARRVHAIVDRNTETGGTVVSEDAKRIVIERDGTRTELIKDHVLEIIELLELQSPTPGIIYRRDGSGFRADIVRDGFDAVEYRIGKVPGSISRAEVYRISLSRSFEEQYEALKKSMHKDDTVRRLALCDWLVSQRKYAEARVELQSLVDDSKSPEAVKLLARVDAQIASMRPRVRPGSGDPVPLVESDRQGRLLPNRVLTPEEVNLIRVYEIDFDRPPRVEVDPAHTKALMEAHSASPLVPADAPSRSALMRGDPLQVVRLAFALKARDFYPNITVVSEPHALAAFRAQVHDSWLIPNCATSRCHGGPDAGRLFLFNTGTADAGVRYANLLNVLMGNIDGTPIVSCERPNESLLIQYALPPEEATHPHPAVKGWKPVLGAKLNPEKLQASLAWIRSLYQPRPVYPIDYTPPDLRLPQPGSASDSDEPSR